MSSGVMLDREGVALFVRSVLERLPELVTDLDRLGLMAGVPQHAVLTIQILPQQRKVLVRQLDAHVAECTKNRCRTGGWLTTPPRIFCRRHYG